MISLRPDRVVRIPTGMAPAVFLTGRQRIDTPFAHPVPGVYRSAPQGLLPNSQYVSGKYTPGGYPTAQFGMPSGINLSRFPAPNLETVDNSKDSVSNGGCRGTSAGGASGNPANYRAYQAIVAQQTQQPDVVQVQQVQPLSYRQKFLLYQGLPWSYVQGVKF